MPYWKGYVGVGNTFLFERFLDDCPFFVRLESVAPSVDSWPFVLTCVWFFVPVSAADFPAGVCVDRGRAGIPGLIGALSMGDVGSSSVFGGMSHLRLVSGGWSPRSS